MASFLALVWLVFIFNQYGEATRAANALEPETQRMRAQVDALRLQDDQVREALTPEQRRMLDAAHLLVDRKTFSWSRLLTDLERALPGGVRVTRIRVRDTVERRAQNYAELELSVISQNPMVVTQMIAEMNRAGTFAVDPLTQAAPRGRGETGTEWTLGVRYTQRAVSAETQTSGVGENLSALPSEGGAPQQ